MGEFGCCWPETVARPEKAVHYFEVEEFHSCSLCLFPLFGDVTCCFGGTSFLRKNPDFWMIRRPFQKMVALAFKPWPCPCISWKTHWLVPRVRFYEAAAGGPKMPLASVTGVANVPAMMGKYFVESSGYWGNVWKCVDMIVAEDGGYSLHKGWCPGSCLRKKNDIGWKALFLCAAGFPRVTMNCNGNYHP